MNINTKSEAHTHTQHWVKLWHQSVIEYIIIIALEPNDLVIHQQASLVSTIEHFLAQFTYIMHSGN